jgi:hypothetical protein
MTLVNVEGEAESRYLDEPLYSTGVFETECTNMIWG